MEIGGKAMVTEKNKGTKWDGKSRVSNDLYRKNFDDIFKKEQDELKESFEQSKRNKKERNPFDIEVKETKISNKELKEIMDRNGF
jgi:hypothetical protein|tara:strand:+ start:1093 stop:1347 length:255 start_codon:yes stop_codon:yes gene_type:complete